MNNQPFDVGDKVRIVNAPHVPQRLNEVGEIALYYGGGDYLVTFEDGVQRDFDGGQLDLVEINVDPPQSPEVGRFVAAGSIADIVSMLEAEIAHDEKQNELIERLVRITPTGANVATLSIAYGHTAGLRRALEIVKKVDGS